MYEAGPTVVDAVTPGGWPPETLAVPDNVPVKVAPWNRPAPRTPADGAASAPTARHDDNTDQ